MVEAFEMTSLYDVPSRLFKATTEAYLRMGRSEAYKLIGSLDVIGSPLGALNRISMGLRDFAMIPWQNLALDDTPGAFWVGVYKGTTSLFLQVSSAMFVTITKLINGVSYGITVCTLDRDYIRQKIRRRRQHPHHALAGVVQGAEELGFGLASGMKGVVMHPYKGGRRSGLSGAAIGVGKGLLGLPLKVAGGVIDLLSKTLEGVKNTTDPRFVAKADVSPVGPTHVPDSLLSRLLASGVYGAALSFERQASVKVVTRRGRLLDRLLVFASPCICVFNPTRVYDDEYVPTIIRLDWISVVHLPLNPETKFVLLLRRVVNGKDSFPFITANREQIVGHMKELHQELQVMGIGPEKVPRTKPVLLELVDDESGSDSESLPFVQ